MFPAQDFALPVRTVGLAIDSKFSYYQRLVTGDVLEACEVAVQSRAFLQINIERSEIGVPGLQEFRPRVVCITN